MKSHWWSSGSGRIELRITAADVDHIANSGQNDADILAVSGRPYMAKQLAKIDPTVLAAELREYGAWDSTELANHGQNLQRVLWIAAWDIADEA